MFNLESYGDTESKFEKEDSGLEKGEVFVIEKSINELVGELNKNNKGLKNRALAYASRE